MNTQFEYILKANDGTQVTVRNDFFISNITNFRYKNKTYQVIDYNGNKIVCRQIPDNLLGEHHTNKNNTKILKFEDKIINCFYKRGKEILPNTLNEKLFTDLILFELEPFFHIKREVEGIHFSGKKVIIDAILEPKDKKLWRNKELVFGFEIKNPLTFKTTNRTHTDMLAQCIDYSQSEFKGIEDMIVVMCPLFPSLREDTLLRFISRYNVGHLDFKDDKIMIGIGGQAIWNNNRPTGIIKYSMMKQKYGNRGGK